MTDTYKWLHQLLGILGVLKAPLARAEALAGQADHGAAFPLFVRAAKAGLPRAWYRLGQCYLMGLGVPPSVGDALRWLGRAAEAGEVPAQTQLAALALQGVTGFGNTGLFDKQVGAPDFAGAEYWSRKAVAAGSAEAKALLGFVLTAGPVERRDLKAGEALYQESAAEGWSRGQLAVAMTLLTSGNPDSAARAMDLLRAAAADGVATAHYVLGTLAESGATGRVDLPAAAASYKAAAELGHAPAQLRLGFALLDGRGVERDPFHAETWLRRAALAGEMSAAAVLGFLYAQDGDSPPNYAEAGVWLQRAAEAGHSAAARTLGNMYLSGAGVHRDMSQAACWLCLAAEAGDPAARAELAHLALTGQVDADAQIAAANCLRRAAEAGDAEAQFSFGLCLSQGIGVAPDGQAGWDWILKSAAAGSPRVMRMLAQLDADARSSMPPQTSE
jgi:TPR repeat protein